MKLILAIVLCACAINTAQAGLPNVCTGLASVAGEAVKFIGTCMADNVSAIPGGATAVKALTKKCEDAVVGGIKAHCKRRMIGLPSIPKIPSVSSVASAACKTALTPLCKVAITAIDGAAKTALLSVGIPTVVSGCILSALEKKLNEKCMGLCRRRRQMSLISLRK